MGRARYERTLDARGSRNGVRPRCIQTADGELTVAMPQARGSLSRFVSSTIPDTTTIIRPRPLEALVIGANVLSDWDKDSLAAEAGLEAISRTTVLRNCLELRDRYRAFRARSLGEVRLLALMLEASLGQRERVEDWLDLGWGLIARGPAQPAPRGGRWRPGSGTYWAALDTATSPAEAEQGLRTVVGGLEREYPRAAACLAEDVAALTVHLVYPLRLEKRPRLTNLLKRSVGEVRRGTKVIRRVPGESSCLIPAWAVMDLVIATAHGLDLSLAEHRAIAAHRR